MARALAETDWRRSHDVRDGPLAIFGDHSHVRLDAETGRLRNGHHAIACLHRVAERICLQIGVDILKQCIWSMSRDDMDRSKIAGPEISAMRNKFDRVSLR